MKPPKIKQSENDVKKAIRDYLELNGWTVFRINNAGTKRKDKKGREFYTFNGTPGVLDMYCLKTGEYPMWIETKATGKIPSEDQTDFIGLVNSASYGRAFWADSFDMFLPIYNDIKKRMWATEMNKYKLPECCGKPVEIFELSGKGKGDWVSYCINCWDGTTPQDSKEAAIKAWEEECT